MNERLKSLTWVMGLALLFTGCKDKEADKDNTPAPTTTDTKFSKVDVTTTMEADRNTKYQTIDGFGFFGAQTVWWDGNSAKLYSDEWARQVINDLGITIWRNEYYPPATATQNQDATWDKQKPVVEGLNKIAKENRVPLKFIFTVWSPPAALKSALDANNNPISGTPNSGGTKGTGAAAGTLDPAKYNEFGNWLADGIQLYKNLGIDVYAISPQNEPFFKQSFNSSFYKPQRWYGEMLKNSIPVVKARFPNVKIFGSENMLEIEAKTESRAFFYGAEIMKDPAALANLDIWAFHGYQEGITPTATIKLAELWSYVNTGFAAPTGKPVWMTETSGYTNNWLTTGGKTGAFDLAMDMQSALYYGNASAWVWWQGSSDQMDEYNLMANNQKGKKYYTSKHFYRYIRPGAKRVKLTFNASDKVLATAYEHTAMNAFTVVFVNASDKSVKVNLTGANVPNEFDYYYTTADVADNCTKREGKVMKDNVVLLPQSIVTLVNGNVVE